MGGSERSGTRNGVSRIRCGVWCFPVDFTCRTASAFCMASNYKRVRVPLQDRSGNRFCRPSPHDQMDSPHYRSPASGLATERFCHGCSLLLTTPHPAFGNLAHTTCIPKILICRVRTVWRQANLQPRKGQKRSRPSQEHVQCGPFENSLFCYDAKVFLQNHAPVLLAVRQH
jgi:hypothetical protein